MTILAVTAGWAAACAIAWHALLGQAQTIRIPDLRQASPAVVSVRPGETCGSCGRIVALQESRAEGRPNVPPALRGGQPGMAAAGSDPTLVGAVIYLPLGETADKPFVGGVGTPEMRERFRETTYKITVRLDDGSVRFLQRYDGYQFRVGDRVRLSGADQVELIAE